MEHLANHNIPCPRPIKSNEGHPIGELKGKPAAILSFVPGLSVEIGSSSECSALGEALANLHLTAYGFPQKDLIIYQVVLVEEEMKTKVH